MVVVAPAANTDGAVATKNEQDRTADMARNRSLRKYEILEYRFMLLILPEEYQERYCWRVVHAMRFLFKLFRTLEP